MSAVRFPDKEAEKKLRDKAMLTSILVAEADESLRGHRTKRSREPRDAGRKSRSQVMRESRTSNQI